MRLQVKVPLLTISIILVVGLLMAPAVLGQLRNASTDQLTQTALALTHVVYASLEHGMVENRPQDVQDAIRRIRGQPMINEIVVISGKGKIAASASEDEIGEEEDDEEILEVLQTGRPITRSEDKYGRTEFCAIVPIFNKPDCFGCHDPQLRVLGAVEVGLQTSIVDDLLRRQTMLLALLGSLTLLAVGAAVTYGLKRVIVDPMIALGQSAKRLSEGNYAARANIRGKDEMGTLARSFNEMAQQIEDRAREQLEWNAELERKVSRRTEELSSLNAMLAVVSGTLKLEEVLEIALERTAEATRADGGWIRLLNAEGDALVLGAHRGVSTTFVEKMEPARLLNGGLSETARETARPVVVEDIELNDTLRLKAAKLAEGWRSQVTMPLISPKGFLGILTLVSRDRGTFNADTERMLSIAAKQIGLAVEKAGLFREAERRNRELAALNSVMTATGGTLELSEVLGVAVQKAAEALGADGGWVRLLSETGDGLDLAASYGISAELAADMQSVPLFGSVAGEVFRGERATLVDDMSANTPLFSGRRMVADGWLSMAMAPLTRKGRVLGIVTLLSRQQAKFQASDLRLLEMVAGQAGLAVENARLFRAVERWNRELATLNSVVVAASSAHELEDVLAIALEKTTEIAGAGGGWVRLLSDTGDSFHLSAWRGIGEPLRGALRSLEKGPGASESGLGSGELLLLRDVREEQELLLRAEIVDDGWRSEMAVALRGKDRNIGVLTLVSQNVGKFGPVSRRLVEMLAGQIGLIVEKARLFDELERHRGELAALNAVMAAVSGTLKFDEVQQIALQQTAGAVGAEGGWLRLRNESEDFFALSASWGLSENLSEALQLLSGGSSSFGSAIRAGMPVLVGDLAEGKSLRLWRELTDEGWQSVIGAPLWGEEGVEGYMVMVSHGITKFTDRDLRLLEMVASQIGLAMQKARLFGEAERHARELEALNAVTTAVSSSLELNEVLEIALEKTAAVLEAEAGWVRLRQEEKNCMVLAAYRGLSADLAAAAQISSVEGGTTAHVMGTGTPLVVADIGAAEFMALRETLVADGWRSMVTAPLKSPTGFLGIITFFSRQKGKFGPGAAKLLEVVAAQMGVALEKAHLYEEMRNRALTNWLTGLYNRGHFEDRLEQEIDRAIRTHKPVSVVMMDVNRFKHFNDTYGHPAGDKVLQGVARGIRGGIRGFDIAARYGGDEFSVILPGTDVSEAHSVAIRIQDQVGKSTAGLIPDNAETITVSAGVACFRPNGHTMTPSALVQIADEALYDAKRQGSGHVCIGQT